MGYVATAFEGGTWEMLHAFTSGVWWWIGLWLGITVVAVMGMPGYLWSGIRRKIQLDSARRRAIHMWLMGEVVAIDISLALTPIFLPKMVPDETLSFLQSFVIAIMYAQIALFIGVFTQLIFDEKPATTPLDSP